MLSARQVAARPCCCLINQQLELLRRKCWQAGTAEAQKRSHSRLRPRGGPAKRPPPPPAKQQQRWLASWDRKGWLRKLEKDRREGGEGGGEDADDEEKNLHPDWAALERRLKTRRPKKKGEGPSGRSNIKKSEEDYWLEGGVYDVEGPASSPEEPARPTFGRMSTIRVPASDVAAVVELYQTHVAPTMWTHPGFCSVELFQVGGQTGAASEEGQLEAHGEEEEVELRSLSVWADEQSLDAASADPKYTLAMRRLQRILEGGGGAVGGRVPETSLLQVKLSVRAPTMEVDGGAGGGRGKGGFKSMAGY